MSGDFYQIEGKEGNEPWKIWGRKTQEGLLIEGLQLGFLEIRSPELILEKFPSILLSKNYHSLKQNEDLRPLYEME